MTSPANAPQPRGLKTCDPIIVTPMTSPAHTPQASRGAQYATLAAALLGWMFDGFEMGLFPLIGKHALKDLLPADANPAHLDQWFGVIMAVFLVGAASGGVLFGWLGDRIGRVRAMSLSIFTYAVFTGFCGFATEAWHIAVLRFIASLGMGGEWSLGVALVNEIWPGKSRAFIAGLIGAASNVGFLLVALLSMALFQVIGSVESTLLWIGVSPGTTENLLQNSAWRFLMISGAFPALLIFFIRLFVPESAKWEEEKSSGRTTHWSNTDLFGVMIGCLAAIGIILVWSPLAVQLPRIAAVALTVIGLIIALCGFLFPARQYLSRAVNAGSVSRSSGSRVLGRMLLGACLAGIALLGTWGSLQWAPRWASELKPDIAASKGVDGQLDIAGQKFYAKELTQAATAVGAIISTIIAAVAAGRFGRRPTYVVLCISAFFSARYFFLYHSKFDIEFLLAAFLAGGLTASFYGFFPLYFPELFPTALRATGQGFSFNFGRIIAAIGGLQTANLMAFFGDSLPKACSAMAGIYLVGVFVIWLGPETKGLELPE